MSTGVRYGPTIHHRRSIRLEGYDYASRSAYYITICIQSRLGLLGRIVGAEVRRSPAGEMIDRWRDELAEKFPGVLPDYRVVMPDHFHDILLLRQGLGDGVPGAGLRDAVAWFKTMTTNAYIRGVKEQGWPRFDSRLWQRNYYERVLRDEDEVYRMRCYIEEDPLRYSLREAFGLEARVG